MHSCSHAPSFVSSNIVAIFLYLPLFTPRSLLPLSTMCVTLAPAQLTDVIQAKT